MKKIIILMFTLLLTGCWNYRELDDIAIVSAISIEKNDDNFDLSVQIMNAKKGAAEGGSTTSSSSSPVTVLYTTGKTVHEALRSVVLQSPKKLYIGHMEVLVIDEKVAYHGLHDIIDFFMRDPESRKQFKVLVTQDNDASDLIKILTPLETLPSHDLLNTIKISDKTKGTIREISYDELLAYIYAEGIEAVVPSAKITGSVDVGETIENSTSAEPNTYIKLNSLAIFNGDRLVGHLSEKESLGYNFITNNVDYSVISFKCDKNNYSALEIVKSSTKFKVDIKDGKPFVKIKVNINSFLSELNCRVDILSLDNLEKLADLAEKDIKQMMVDVIKRVQQQYGSDIFGFGQYLYRNNQEYWQKNKYNWTSIFQDIEYDIDVNLVIDKKGSIIGSAKEG